VNTVLAADGTVNYVSTFSVSILAESLGYDSNTVSNLYNNSTKLLSNSVTSGSFVSTVKTLAQQKGYADFSALGTSTGFIFSNYTVIYLYASINTPTFSPTIKISSGNKLICRSLFMLMFSIL